MKRIVPTPEMRRRSLASATTVRTSATPELTAERLAKWRLV